MLKLLIMSLLLYTAACTAEDNEPTPSSAVVENITMSVGGHSFVITMEQNTTAEAFYTMLPMTLDMNELNGNEKYCYINQALPTNTVHPSTIRAGDVMLYGDDCVVVFYETFSTSYAYSPIGHVSDTEHLKDALGSGGVSVSFAKQ